METPLASPRATREVLDRHGLRPRKGYGQNFLVDPNILRKIVEASGIGPEDLVLEVGPGIGTLTQALCQAAGSVLAVEVDSGLLPVLSETLAPYPNVEVWNRDALELDFAVIAREKNRGRPFAVVANLPYYITTPLLLALLESEAPFSSLTVMVQKEVADRISASPGSKDYGALSLAVAYRARAETVFSVPPSCFFPQPKVGSAVVHLTLHAVPPVEGEREEIFRLIRGAFLHRRKNLPNALAMSCGLPKEKTENAMKALGWPTGLRGEALSLQQFAALAEAIEEENSHDL